MATSYYPDSKHHDSLEVGHEFQDFVITQLLKYGIVVQVFTSKKYQFEMGESRQGVEIKLDNLCTKTGRLSIEIAEKSRARNAIYVPSGIYRNDNTWLYVQGNYEILYVFFKSFLKQLHGVGKYQVSEKPTIKSFYLPTDDAERYAGLIIRIPKEEKELKKTVKKSPDHSGGESKSGGQ